MKKVLTIIAVLAFVACGKTEPVYEETGEILISPVSENVTKVMMPKGQFLGSSFNVWAWHNPTPSQANAVNKFQQGFEDSSTTMYVDEKPFVKKDEAKDLWGGQVSYYWPNTGSLLFAGYHAPGMEGKVSYTFNATENKMVFSDIQQSSVIDEKYAEDIMYFNMTTSSYNKISNEVSLKFKHALTWITVTLAKRANPVIEAEITIKDVTFTEVSEKGTGTVNGTSPIEWAASSPEPFSFPGLPMLLEYDKGIDGKPTTKVYKLEEQLFIPQDIAGLLVVKYAVKSTDGSEFTEIYKVDLTTLKEGSHNAWEAGKHYTYNLSIGTDEILVTPSVEPWVDVDTSILIPLPEDMYDSQNNQNNN